MRIAATRRRTGMAFGASLRGTMRAGQIAMRVAAMLAFLAIVPGAGAQIASPHAIDIPRWFTETFLDFREDVRDAARDGKRLMVYFGQDGCPYCKQLMATTFTETRIVEKTRRRFVAVALNLWGDREVTWIDGKVMSEKELGRVLKVQFTPTLLFFDEKANVVLRLNGYQPPHRMAAALDYVGQRLESKGPFAEYLQRAAPEPAAAQLASQPFFMRTPNNLARKPGGKPLLVLFERRECASCDELHRDGFRRDQVLRSIARFDVARFESAAVGARDLTEIVGPDGRRRTVSDWARELNVTFAPTLVFFDERGREVFRVDSYVRPFHLASALEYVATGAYREQPSFQRFVQARADKMRERGQAIDLWK
jgi:thioredoxin-related protein